MKMDSSPRIGSEWLATWVEAGWVIPQDKASQRFSDIDMARAALIRDLIDLGINEEAVPVILDLIDQLHGMRSAMRNLMSAMAAQSETTRYRIAARLSATHGPAGRDEDASG
jgi:chaperone modulatory protein CbpM